MSTDQSAPVTHIAIKLPLFWPSDPAIWFAQGEAQFATRGITSETTNFHHIIIALSPEIAVEVRDILLQPPFENPYMALKEALTVRTAESTQLRFSASFPVKSSVTGNRHNCFDVCSSLLETLQ